MPAPERDSLVGYFQQELTYLREQGATFARRYPKVAAHLELGHDESADPHVERLMEAFAFLTARLQRNIDDEFREIPAALLGLIYPQFTAPVPPMAIARFIADPGESNLAAGFTVEKGAALFAESPGERVAGMSSDSPEGLLCRFQTGYPVTLWPLVVKEARLESPGEHPALDIRTDVMSVVRIRCETALDSVADLELERLRFFISGHRQNAYALYELLCTHCIGVAIQGEGDEAPRMLVRGAVSPVGFAADEDLIPYPPNAHAGYRLLQEYACFPDKFLFIDVDGIQLPGGGRAFDLLFLTDEMPSARVRVERETFLLGCTPIINLFRKTTEPIRIDETQYEYRLIPDLHRERITEIHSIDSVSAMSDFRDRADMVAPYFSYEHEMELRGQSAFWYARREDTAASGLPGTGMQLAFVDLDFQPALPTHQTVYAHTWCTNRDLAEQLHAGAGLQVEAAVPVLRSETRAGILVQTKPTPQRSPPLEGAAYWRLVSHLSLNYLSVSEGTRSPKALREILRLYGGDGQPELEHALQGIRGLTSRRVVRRLGMDAWRGFSRGTEVTLTLDEGAFTGTSSYLLAEVLRRFLELLSSPNSFVSLVVKRTDGDKSARSGLGDVVNQR